jgi:CobQ-like glutamine amidotransferase family enzyme
MNKSVFALIATVTFTSIVGAATLRERNPQVYKYDVLFTNPTCASYKYPKKMETQKGDFKEYTKENVFCTSGDRKITAKRDGSSSKIGEGESPQHRLLKVINDIETKEIFMTYLSFSDSTVARALCQKMTKGMKLELVLDQRNEQGSIDRTLSRSYLRGKPVTSKNRAKAERAHEKAIKSAKNKYLRLTKISNPSKEQKKKLAEAVKNYESLLTKSQYLGSEICSSNGVSKDQNYKVKKMKKQKGIGWSHTKVFMVNPTDKEKITVSFASANMSSGTTIHHENWHFVTASTNSHFMQIHLCLKNAEFDHANSRNEFMNYIKKCRSEIKVTEEDDIKVFIAPGEGEEAVEVFTNAIKWSKNVDLAAHRFTLRNLMSALKDAKKSGTNVRMVFDDDLYYAGERRLAEGLRVPNMAMEYGNLKKVIGEIDSTLEQDNIEARYMTTNHYAHTIHHNKYLILDNAKKGRGKPAMFKKPAVFCGAGNFTKAAFMKKNSTTNLENYYYITIPEVVEAFKKQYDYKWDQLATPYGDMNLEDLQPTKR